jgi:hypothetical protein
VINNREEPQMRSREELTSLFTTYFGDKLSPIEIDILVADVMAGMQNRRARGYASTQAVTTASQPAPMWSAAFA